jgi:hypothetical protein
MITGSQKVSAAVGATSNSASEPCPSCQNQVIAPDTAVSETRLFAQRAPHWVIAGCPSS